MLLYHLVALSNVSLTLSSRSSSSPSSSLYCVGRRMMMSGCRITHQVRAWEILGIYSKLRVTCNSKPSPPNSNPRRRRKLFGRNSSGIVGSGKGAMAFPPPPPVSCLQSKHPGESPALSDCFSQKEDNSALSSEGLTSIAGGIVALGKFDALHIGHRELAVQASKVGAPYLLSFVGMAEVLGWEPRAPIVATCDRQRVLSLWAPCCGRIAPQEFVVEFSTVRHLTPRQFIEKLAKEFGVCGIVAGENYRFGYQASGDTSDLVRMCKEYGIGAYIVKSVMDKNQAIGDSCLDSTKERGQVSSTRVRYALAKGDVNYVKELLGRRHCVILSLENREAMVSREHGIFAPVSCLLNLLPKQGFYDKCSLIVGNENPLPCRVTIDAQNIHLDLLDEVDFLHLTQGIQLVSIEFGDS